jgi:precorrin-8X/cobalt-precorrin-8 methylmutase
LQIVATPVGFIKAAESRNRIRAVATEYGVPAITTVGRRGGSGLAAGLTNELVHVASDVRDGEVTLETAQTESNRHDHREVER